MTWPPPLPPGASAGWYTTPSDPDPERYWTGRAWTSLTRPHVVQQWAPPPGYPPPSPPPRRKSWYEREWLWGGGAVVLVLLIVAAIIGPQHDDANQAAPNAGSGPSTFPLITQPASHHHRTPMQRWARGPTLDDLQAVEEAQTEIGQSASEQDPVAIAKYCRHLQADVIAVQSDPPPPDETERRYLNKAMTLYAQAAAACLSSDYYGFAHYDKRGTRVLDKATARLHELGG